MVVVKPRTAIVIVLTILAAAVFSLILLPRWQSTKTANSAPPVLEPSDQSASVNPKPLSESLAKVDKLEADKEAIWSPHDQGQPGATRKGVPPSPMNPETRKPGGIERVGQDHLRRPESAFDSPRKTGSEPAGRPGEEAERGGINGQRLLRKLKESVDSQPPPHSSSKEPGEKTPNTVKYERLMSLLGRMHDPLVKPGRDRDLAGNDKAKLSKVLAKEAVEKLTKKYNNKKGESGLEIDKPKEPGRDIPLLLGTDNDPPRPGPRARERQLMNKVRESEGERPQEIKPAEANTNLNRNNNDNNMPQRFDSSVNTAMGNPSDHRHKEKPTTKAATTPVLTTTMATTTPRPPPLTTVAPTTLPPAPKALDLPSMMRGSVEIRPERIPPPAHSSDIYYSLLTAPVYHNLRFSLQYLTWLQTVDLKQVSVVTDKDDNEWIQAFKKEGGNVHLPKCPLSTRKTREMMCCKTGAQFDYWYKAREAGLNYKWYCHFDDDLYVNPQALANLLSQYDPTTDQYLGAWAVVGRVHRQNRIPGNMLAPKLHTYAERKRDDFRYANGPSYCISEALMMKVEKYLRGKNFEDNCRKSDTVMDDVLPGVIIDGVLGVDLKDIPGFKSQLDFMINTNSQDMKRQAQDIISIGFGRFSISDARFPRNIDTKGVLSYHCLLHPEVSWCQR